VDFVGWGGTSSLVVDPTDYPRISYHSYRSFDSRNLVYAYMDATGWHTETVDSQAGRAPSMKLDENDYPHVSYVGNDELRYAYQDATGWHTETVADMSFEGIDRTSLSLDDQDFPHVAYYGYGSLQYAYKNASGWHFETVDTGDRVGWYASLALDSRGYPHISYFDETDDVVRYAYKDASGWHSQILDDAFGSTFLALDKDDHPHIAYSDTDTLKYIHQAGTDWHIETVDVGRGTGDTPSIALDSVGNPYISYHDFGRGDLMLAYRFVAEQTIYLPLCIKHQ
jgi:hypothetical protein